MKKLLAMAMLACTIAAQAQEMNPKSKFGMDLQMHLGMNVNHSKTQTRGEDAPKVKVLVSLVPTAGITAADLEAVGCEVKWAMKSVASVIVSVDQLEALAAIPGVRNIDLPKKVELHNDIARGVVHVDKVADPKTAVAAGLPKEYDGTGVLVGIIDNGIDYRHYAFRDEEGNTRFQKTFTSRMEMKDGESFHIHTNPEEILSVKALESKTHGTHVLGIMTGQDLGNDLQGMAPKAGIIAVDIEEFTNDCIIEGMKHACEYAEENHLPIAINMSIGANEGWTDGCAPISAAMVELTDNGTKPGVIFSLSSGNQGDYCNWVTHKFTTDDEKLFVICEPTNTFTIFEGRKLTSERIHAWTNRLVDNKEEMLAVFDIETNTMIEDPETIIGTASVYSTEENGETKYHLADELKGTGPGTKKLISLRSLREMLKEDGLYSSSIHTCADGKTQKNEMWYHIKFGIHVKLYENLRLGACFSYPAGTEIRVGNFSNITQNGRFIKPDGFDFAKASSADGNINIYACNAANITTGSYCIRDRFTNYYGYESIIEKNVVNDVSYSSSYGYTFDEQHLAKPEVLAPGSYLLSAANNYYNEYFSEKYGVLKDEYDHQKNPERAGNIASKVTIDGQDYWYYYNSGTSMAAPVTTGIIALWLQANPNLSVADVREIIAHTATPFISPNKDNDPLKSSAYGIINALEGLKYINAHMTSISNVSIGQEHDNASPVYNLFGQPTQGQGFVVRDGHVVFVK